MRTIKSMLPAFIALVVLAISLAATAFAVKTVQTGIEAQAKLQFDKEVDGVKQAMHTHLEQLTTLMQAVRGGFASSSQLNRDEFGSFVATLEMASRYPSVNSMTYVARVPAAEVRAAARLPDDSTLVARQLCEMQGSLYASPAYLARYGTPEQPADLLAHVCLGAISGTGEALPWQLARGVERWEGMPTGPLSANSRSLQRDLAAHGLGIVGLADRFAAKWVEQGLLKRVLPEWTLPTVTIWCVTPGRRLLPVRTTAFIDLLRAAMESR